MKLRHIYINKEGEPMGKTPDGLLPFDDAMKIFPLHVRLTDIKPDTLIPVEIEVEVVREVKLNDGKWYDIENSSFSAFDIVDSREILRIKN